VGDLQFPKPKDEREIIAWSDFVAQFIFDPLGFVLTMWPWLCEATELEQEEGPDTWQVIVLDEIGKQLREGVQTVRIAVASGHGSGKSALMAWINIWFQTCFPRNKARTTAGTQGQLSSATWREVAKWHDICRNRWQFDWTKTRLTCKWKPSTWYAEAMPWSEHNAQAFAGLHEEIVLIQFDEASTIADTIWDTVEGAFTTRGIFLAFGNPTEAIGKFADCFGRNKRRWTTIHVDARDAKKANKLLFQQWIEDYGINSDFVRVRVLGLFPIGQSVSFIAPADIQTAIDRNKDFDFRSLPRSIPTIMGIDVARAGGDQSVFLFRKGRWVSSNIYRYDEPDLMRLASFAAEKIRLHEPDLIMVDEVGLGAGVLDRLRQLGFAAIGIHAGARPDDEKLYRNKRAELWARMKTWLKEGGILPNDTGLRTSLEIPSYGFTDANEKLLIESKDSIKSRGASSPDEADALAMTFAMAVPVKIHDQEYNLEPEVV
jgi:hypothetical protein